MEVSLVYNIDNLALKRIAEIHKLNYPSDHLTSQFTSDMLCDYYRLIADLSDYIILAHYKGEIIGFAFLGGSFGSVLPSLVMNNKLKILNFTIRRPSIVLGFVLNKFFTENYHLDSSSNIRLISITTDKFFRKLRVGTHIVTKLENLQVEKNLDVGLSVKASNFKAVNFYIKSGYIVEGYSKGKLFMVKKYA